MKRKLKLSSREITQFDFGVAIQAFYNRSEEDGLLLVFEDQLSEGLEAVYEQRHDAAGHSVFAEPSQCKIILFKIDPTATVYRFSNQK